MAESEPRKMRIGVFDSGLGGLAIAESIVARLPQYDYVYLGDTKRVPYGGRSQETIHEYTSQALTYLFEQDCALVVIACNTASAESLRKSQQEYLPKHYPNRRILGVIVPTAEAVTDAERGGKIGLLATRSTVDSGAFEREIHRHDPSAQIVAQAAPLLVPIIENGGLKYLPAILEDYLAPMGKVDAIILGCTHYCLIKEEVRRLSGVRVISQDEIVPEKLADYLERHPEIESRLGRNGRRDYFVTDLSTSTLDWADRLRIERSRLCRIALD